MIRSRDLVIFVAVLLFLFLAIAITLFLKNESIGSLQESLVFFDVSKEASSTFTAVKTESLVNKEDTIARLRRLLSLSDTVIVPTPSVELENEINTETASESVTSEFVVKRCGGADDAGAVIQSWPKNGVQMIARNGVRSIVQVKKEIDSATSSVPAILVSTTTLLKMSAYPVVTSNMSCIGSDVIGVTNNSGLLLNQSASLYKGYGPDDLIGYARDGFPIYGVYDGVTDACGGYQNVKGYRYSIGAARDFILGCYVGTPSLFEGL